MTRGLAAKRINMYHARHSFKTVVQCSLNSSVSLSLFPSCLCVCVVVPQVVDAMSDSTTSSTTANDLDLIYLKGIMESPLVWHTHI